MKKFLVKIDNGINRQTITDVLNSKDGLDVKTKNSMDTSSVQNDPSNNNNGLTATNDSNSKDSLDGETKNTIDTSLVQNDSNINKNSLTVNDVLNSKDGLDVITNNEMDTTLVQNDPSINNNELTATNDLNSKESLDFKTKNTIDTSLVQTDSNVDKNGLTESEIQKSKDCFVQIERLNLSTTNVLNALNTEDDDLKNKSSKYKKFYQDYKIGDIVWAKLGTFPYWPSVVCLNPESKTHIKETKNIIWIHVRFCYDNGRRSWIRQIEHYSGKSAFQSKYPYGLSSIKNKVKQLKAWNSAADEADRLLLILDRDVRIVQFFKLFSELDNPDCLNASASNNETVTTKNLANKVPVILDTTTKNVHSNEIPSTSGFVKKQIKKVAQPLTKKRRSTKKLPTSNNEFPCNERPFCDDGTLDDCFDNTKMAVSTQRLSDKRKLQIKEFENRLHNEKNQKTSFFKKK